MAIDSKLKRLSMMNIGVPWRGVLGVAGDEQLWQPGRPARHRGARTHVVHGQIARWQHRGQRKPLAGRRVARHEDEATATGPPGR